MLFGTQKSLQALTKDSQLYSLRKKLAVRTALASSTALVCRSKREEEPSQTPHVLSVDDFEFSLPFSGC